MDLQHKISLMSKNFLTHYFGTGKLHPRCLITLLAKFSNKTTNVNLILTYFSGIFVTDYAKLVLQVEIFF